MVVEAPVSKEPIAPLAEPPIAAEADGTAAVQAELAPEAQACGGLNKFNSRHSQSSVTVLDRWYPVLCWVGTASGSFLENNFCLPKTG